jgi:hypothetical protein
VICLSTLVRIVLTMVSREDVWPVGQRQATSWSMQ